MYTLFFNVTIDSAFKTQTPTQILYFNNQHFMYTIDHNITWEFIWSIVQEWLIFGDGDPFAFTSGDD